MGSINHTTYKLAEPKFINMTAHPVNLGVASGEALPGVIATDVPEGSHALRDGRVFTVTETFEPCGYTFRLDEEWVDRPYTLGGRRIVNREVGDLIVIDSINGEAVEGIGDERIVENPGATFGFRPHTYYIVSAQVLNACPERTDFVAPALIHRDGPVVLGCEALSSHSEVQLYRED